MPQQHKRHGGSTEARLLNCPVCHNIADKAPKIDRTSTAAERGTFLHDLMEDIYNDDITLHSAEVAIADSDYGRKEWESLQLAHNATEDAFHKLGIDEWVCEPFMEAAPDEGGSADMLFTGPKYAGVLDYKFGHQKVDNQTWNAQAAPEQLFFYLDLAMNHSPYADMFEGKELMGVIIQPEVSHAPLFYSIDPERLKQWRKEHALAISISRSGSTDNPRTGSWCQYCPGAPYCPAKRAQSQRFVALESADNQELDEAVALLDAMEEQIKAVKREIMHNLEAGINVRGLKLVEKRARRHWIDEAAALETFKKSKLSKAVYLEPDQLRSPAQIEKAIKAAGKSFDPSDLITSSSSGLTYAPVSDKRPAVTPPNVVPDKLKQIIGG